MNPDTEQILIHNDSLHAENRGMCEYEGLIERDRYSEVLLILITVRDWSADNDVGCNFYIDLKLMAFRVLENILLIKSSIPKEVNCPFTGVQTDGFFFLWVRRKLYAIFFRLEGTEEKFRNRESRPEDLQVIAELKDMVAEREALVKKLVVSASHIALISISLHHTIKLLTTADAWISSWAFQRLFLDLVDPAVISDFFCCVQDDKKFYQLELVNRETNFNKVFNASPNVGVINPLIKVS